MLRYLASALRRLLRRDTPASPPPAWSPRMLVCDLAVGATAHTTPCSLRFSPTGMGYLAQGAPARPYPQGTLTMKIQRVTGGFLADMPSDYDLPPSPTADRGVPVLGCCTAPRRWWFENPQNF